MSVFFSHWPKQLVSETVFLKQAVPKELSAKALKRLSPENMTVCVEDDLSAVSICIGNYAKATFFQPTFFSKLSNGIKNVNNRIWIPFRHIINIG